MIVPGVQLTAMHSPGVPSTEPSESQYGNAGSAQLPSLHVAAGFDFVQLAAQTNARIHRRPTMDRG
jgi:hypothetical protein